MRLLTYFWLSLSTTAFSSNDANTHTCVEWKRPNGLSDNADGICLDEDLVLVRFQHRGKYHEWSLSEVNARFTLGDLRLQDIPLLSCTNATVSEVSQLGSQGGSKRVYRASYNGLPVAISKSKNAYNYFFDIEYLALLKSPHIVNLIGVCEHERELAYFTQWMPYTLSTLLGLHGRSSKRMITKLSRERPTIRLELASSLAQGVAYLHNTRFGSMLLCDFGLHQVMVDNDYNVIFHDLGGNRYNNCKRMKMDGYGTESDVYFLGCILIQVAGHDARCIQSAKFKQDILIQVPERFKEIDMHPWSKDYIALIMRCLSPSEIIRPTAAEVSAELLRLKYVALAS